MIDRTTLADKIWALIDVEENADATWYEDADVLFEHILYGLVISAIEHQDISESEFAAYVDYKKEQLRRQLFGAGTGKPSRKQKDFGDKRDLK
jgi:hypothetical protein